MRISDWSSDVCSSDLFIGEQAHHQAVDQAARGDRLRLAIGEDELRVLLLEQGLAERDALADIGDGEVERALDADDGVERDDQPFPGKLVHELLETAPGAAEQMIVRHEHVVEGEFGRSEEHTSELQSLMPLSYAV